MYITPQKLSEVIAAVPGDVICFIDFSEAASLFCLSTQLDLCFQAW